MIEVRVTQEDLRKYQDPAEEQKMVLQRLRDAGIPVYGLQFLVSLERGELTIRRLSISQDIIYSWRDRG